MAPAAGISFDGSGERCKASGITRGKNMFKKTKTKQKGHRNQGMYDKWIHAAIY